MWARVFLLGMLVPGALALGWSIVAALMTGQISPVLSSLPAIGWTANPLGFVVTVLFQIVLGLCVVLMVFADLCELRRYFAARRSSIGS
ncbi:hypothetical protein ACG3SL_13965 [Sphingomonas sp. CJ20]